VFTSTEYTENNLDGSSSGGTYDYTVTGLNTATLVLHNTSEGSTTTVYILFVTATTGYYASISVDYGGESDTQGGTFYFGP